MLIYIALSLGACTEAPRPETDDVVGGKWYYLEQGRFREAGSPASIRQTPLLPWTVQARVSDLIRLDSHFYLAVNGYGIAACALVQADAAPVFTYYFDPIVFEFRTITLLMPHDDTVLCHLYFNTTLNTTGVEDLTIQGVSLVRLLPTEETYRFVILPFQKGNPEWESPTVLPVGREQFYIQWKFTDDGVSRFEYTEFDMGQNREVAGNAQEFRRAFGFRDVRDTREPLALVSLFDLCDDLLREAQGAALEIHYHLRSEDNPVTWRRRSRPSDADLHQTGGIVTVPVYLEAGAFYGLLPNGTVVWVDPQGQSGVVRLPRHPDSFVFTGLVKRGDIIIASWEEPVFYNVGRAGIFVGGLP